MLILQCNFHKINWLNIILNFYFLGGFFLSYSFLEKVIHIFLVNYWESIY